MADNHEDSREHGVEFGSLADELEDETYPLTQEEVLDRYSDHELELESGTTLLGDVLDAQNEREYETAEAVRQAIFSMVGEEAVGRDEYSDRGGTSPDSTETDEAESF